MWTRWKTSSARSTSMSSKIDGHDFEAIRAAFAQARATKGMTDRHHRARPSKGKGDLLHGKSWPAGTA